jgi:hypothetical protein
LLACGHGARNVTPWQREWRSFGEFLAGDVEVWGGRMKGREAFAEVAGLSGALALGVTLLGLVIALSRP